MDWSKFIIVGENIHCTRIVKKDGAKTVPLPGGGLGIAFKYQGKDRVLPVPDDWARLSPAMNDGKIKHVALAVYQALHGSGDAPQAGLDYLNHLADRQIKGGAAFLDVNVDEYSSDPQQTAEVMVFVVRHLGSRYTIPLSIDSSNLNTLQTGLENCRKDIAPPMINSISLERTEAIDLAKRFNADAIINAGGRTGMPNGIDDRLANFREIVGLLEQAGIPRSKLHLDPLVFPISTDPLNGANFLTVTTQAKAEFAGVHLNGGLSNVSFGMPNRNLLNVVFAWLCAAAGTDGGIIDPVTMPVAAISSLDPATEPFKLARAVLTGEDLYGGEYIAAFREGRLGGSGPA